LELSGCETGEGEGVNVGGKAGIKKSPHEAGMAGKRG
jgi:hypothetical protein